MKTPSLIHDDLSTTICGRPKDSASVSPFVSSLITRKMARYFCSVGYIPFIRNCLKGNTVLEELIYECKLAKIVLKEQGFKVDGIFGTRLKPLPY